jgi:uncharacterized membrane protein YccC
MHYALTPRTFIYSHYFYTGLRVATGIIGLTSLVLWFTDMPTAMAVCIGALCTSLLDLPGPLHHKFNEMLASALLGALVTLAVSLCAGIPALLFAMLALVCFFTSMMVVYGKKSLPLQFAALLGMALSIESTLSFDEAFIHTALFLAGGLAYLAYAMAIAWLLRRRTRQQVLAEALYELGRYVELKAGCYDVCTDLNQQFNLLVRQQVVLADKQQASRDLVLRGMQTDGDAMLVQVHFFMLDLYERVLSTHADYALLRSKPEYAPMLALLRSLVGKASQDIESVAYAVTRKRVSSATISYAAELQALDRELRQLQEHGNAGPAPSEAFTLLRVASGKLRDVIDMIGQLHRATGTTLGPLPVLPGADMTPFLTQQKYELRLLLSHLRWSSATFRFALRVTFAVATGVLIARHMPYAAHGYWVVLTIIVILKPTFSMTRQRRGDRLIGTTIGCIATSLILHFVHAPAGLLAFLFLASAAAPAFTYVKYRYTAIAASMQILLQINLLLPAGSHAISERLIDTAIGAAIATVFSFVLPSWEYRALPQLIRKVLQANQAYLQAGRELLQARVKDDLPYRLCRKRFMDSLANLSAALVRMLDEPADKQRAVQDIDAFIMQNYLVVAHVAALRLLMRRHEAELPRDAVNALLQQGCADAVDILAQAQCSLSPSQSTFPVRQTVTAPAQSGIAPPLASAWSGWHLLQRRIGLLHADARQIATRCTAIGRALASESAVR